MKADNPTMARSRTSTTFLRLLRSSNIPVYALDAKSRIIFVNPALEQWLGVDEEELVLDRIGRRRLRDLQRELRAGRRPARLGRSIHDPR